MQPRAQAIRYAAAVELRTADDVWARIDPLTRDEPGGVVATDGDGTLWSGDVGEDLFHAFVEHGRVEPVALEAIQRSAREHSVSDAGSGPDVARRIYAAYVEGRFPERTVCELMTWCFAGWTASDLRAFARDVVDRGGLARRLHGEVLHVIDRARAAGIATVVVSASPVAVVVEAAARLGFGEGDVVAARPRFEHEVMLADVERPIPYADGKVTRLRERIGATRPLYAAFGDNGFDVAMLAEARVGVAVRPKPKLRARAHEVRGLVELSPRGR
jgi:phosphoserine phosphatase